MNRPLVLIVLAQLFGTSLWFSANSVADGLASAWGMDAAGIGHLTSAVQAGFIVGSALAIQNGIGFSITVVAICVATAWMEGAGPRITWLLAPGPFLGLMGMAGLLRARRPGDD